MTDQTPRTEAGPATEAGRWLLGRIGNVGRNLYDIKAVEMAAAAQARAETLANAEVHLQARESAGFARGLAQARAEALTTVWRHGPVGEVTQARAEALDVKSLRRVLAFAERCSEVAKDEPLRLVEVSRAMFDDMVTNPLRAILTETER